MVRISSIFSASNLLAWHQSVGIWSLQGEVALGRFIHFSTSASGVVSSFVCS